MLYEFFTRTRKLPLSIAGLIACGCKTCAPKYANSCASSKLRNGMGIVFSISLGSALKTPSTSFHTCTSSSANAAPITVAVKSDPPLPNVDIAPVFSPLPKNPVTTEICGSAPSGNVKLFFIFAYVSGNTLPFSMSSSLVTIPISNASYCFAFTPLVLK